MADSLIYIPDITGFTNFVNTTEISHAQHIISELLEIIIDNNQLGMQVSEVEGDAVLFYKSESVPTIQEVVDQSERIFIAFQEHVLRYENERVCQCGACSGVAKLSLKIISHSGPIGFTSVKKKKKPFGPTLVEAHRLLKNSIAESEYLLITHPLASKKEELNGDWISLFDGEPGTDHENLKFVYAPLTPLLDRVPPPIVSAPPEKISNPVVDRIQIDKPLFFVFEMVSNLDLRLLWNKSVKDLVYEHNKTNRVGTRHRCLFNNGFADFETITNDFGDDYLVYGEKIDSVPLAKDFSVYYILSGDETTTEVRVEVHYHPKPIYGWIFIPFIRAIGRKNIKKALLALKEACEESAEIEYNVVGPTSF